MSSPAWEYATLTLAWTRLALPVFLGSSLLATGLVAILSWLLYGVRKQPIYLEDDAEKAESATTQTCPSRDVLLLLLNLLTSTYAVEALVLLLQATFSHKVGCSRIELLASWATLTTYSIATCVLAGDEASDAAGKPYLRVFSTATLAASMGQMGASMTLTYLGDDVSSLHFFYLPLSTVRLMVATLLALSFLPAFQAECVREEKAREQTLCFA